MIKWLTLGWWQFLLKHPLTWCKFWCRTRGHKGIIFFNPGGSEPDYHCKCCGDDLG